MASPDKRHEGGDKLKGGGESVQERVTDPKIKDSIKKALQESGFKKGTVYYLTGDDQTLRLNFTKISGNDIYQGIELILIKGRDFTDKPFVLNDSGKKAMAEIANQIPRLLQEKKDIHAGISNSLNNLKIQIDGHEIPTHSDTFA